MVEHVHMIGIGGTGMSSIATVLLQMGYKVSGSDVRESAAVNSLQNAGADVHIGHAASHVAGADIVVFSSAIPDDNPEIQEARRLGIPLLHRSEMLARILNNHDGIAVAGAHGKTTITGMIAQIFSSLGLEPTVLAGGEMQNHCVHACWGRGRHVVAEADESDGSFLRYYPKIAVITSVEADHLENFGGRLSELIDSYARFLTNIKTGGTLVISGQAYQVLQDSISKANGRFSVIVYGLEGEPAGLQEEKSGQVRQLDYRAADIKLSGPTSSFTVYKKDKPLGRARLIVPGAYNVENALAAIAVSQEVGLDFERIVEALEGFHGAHRRFERVGESHGVVVYDDYAHHPTELKKALQAARYFGRRVVAIFQPQRYSRTKILMEEFARSFQNADLVVITDIYAPPPEKPLPGVSAERLAELVAEQIGRDRVLYIGDKELIPDALLPHLGSNDLVLTMGAGDVWQVGPALLERLQEKKVKKLQLS
ncbi:MAG: UDP-N-acetylmuramate--L-alanine ligase [Firmicutes bacterium]|nr:UDP-N-acetylmuramate--L-alanine ligase [Bacillota bacterium]